MMPTAQMPRRDVTGARIGAWFIDIILLGALSLGIIFGMGGFETNSFSSRERARAYCEQWEDDNLGGCSIDRVSDFDSDRFGSWTTTQVRIIPNLLVAAINLLAYPLIQGLTGATPGKALVGLRVVQRDGRICGVWRSFLRHILWVADSIICGVPVVGGAVMLSTQHKQRVGDLAAGTFVVHRSEVGTPIQDQVWGQVAPPMAPGPYGTSGHPGFQPGSGAHGWAPPPVPSPQSGPGAPAGWGQGPATPSAPTSPSSAGSFGPPSTPTSPPSADLGGTGADDGPQWDAARDTYIQYDPALGAWMQWNDTSKAWERIE